MNPPKGTTMEPLVNYIRGHNLLIVGFGVTGQR